MTATDTVAELQRAVARLPAGLRDHVLRVVAEAQRLAPLHGVDPGRAALAALGHDLYRGLSPEELLAEAARVGLIASDVERSQPILLHGRLAARELTARYGVTDADVLAAARYHTTARASMSRLERLLYVADKIEEEKAAHEPALAEARELAETDLDAAVRRILDYQVARAVERGWPLHPDTVAARDELLTKP